MALKLPAGGTLALAALLVLAAAGAAVFAPAREPLAGREATLWLAVESGAVDHDDLMTKTDRERFAQRFGHEPSDVLVQVEGDEKHFDAPWLWTSLAIALRRLAGSRGPWLLQAALLAIAALAAQATLRSRLGAASGALLVAVALFGSAAYFVPLRLEPRALELAAMAIAAATVWARRVGPERGSDHVFRGELGAGAQPLRFLAAGAAFGIVAAGNPSYLWLALPLLAAAPHGHRLAARALFAFGTLVVFAAIVWAGGAPWDLVEPRLSLALFGWNGVAVLAGRGVGLLPYFAPALLLVVTAGRVEGRRWALPAVLLALLSQLLLTPFDVVESAAMPGNAWFLPLLALLLLAAEHAEAPGWTLAAAALSGMFLLPQWVAPFGANELSARLEARLAPIAELLPLPSTQRELPGDTQLDREGLAVHGFAPALAPADGRFAMSARNASLLLVSERPLSSVRLELGAAAPVDFEVLGGKAGNTTLRPNGEVALDVGLDPRRARRHPVWWSEQSAWIYPLEVRLPKRPQAPLPLDVAYGRLAVPTASAR